jgi:hypothetical protein
LTVRCSDLLGGLDGAAFAKAKVVTVRAIRCTCMVRRRTLHGFQKAQILLKIEFFHYHGHSLRVLGAQTNDLLVFG